MRNLLCQGLSNKEISQKLNISVSAVKYYNCELLKEAGLYGKDQRRFMVWLLKGEI